ncbi:MAG TPA: epoxyqueuosine reductase QueH [Candidatus Humimicrobiaceae bacterium]|nr:epoxyqueuosine reductase QueH [Candidatus Humimicrobiaceae bacterium]
MPEYSTSKPKILLHACCGTCALYPYFLLEKDFNVTLFYYNPNLYPGKEYIKRLEGLKTISKKYDISLITGKYENKKWLSLTADFKDDPEGGRRCALCFEMRLDETAHTAKKLGFDFFGTTLTISPHKNHETINSIGMRLASAEGVNFYESNLKKMNGFKKTMELSKELNLYRQDYCSCVYSMK